MWEGKEKKKKKSKKMGKYCVDKAEEGIRDF